MTPFGLHGLWVNICAFCSGCHNIVFCQCCFPLRVIGNHCDFEISWKVLFVSSYADLNRVCSRGNERISTTARLGTISVIFSRSPIIISEVPLAPPAIFAYPNKHLGIGRKRGLPTPGQTSDHKRIDRDGLGQDCCIITRIKRRCALGLQCGA